MDLDIVFTKVMIQEQKSLKKLPIKCLRLQANNN